MQNAVRYKCTYNFFFKYNMVFFRTSNNNALKVHGQFERIEITGI